MRIGIDARLWNETGIGRYIRNLVLNLIQIDKKNDYVLFVSENDRQQIQSALRSNKHFKLVSFNAGWHSFSEQISFPKILKKERLDLMHFPYFSVPIFYNLPYVVTIHDLVYHHFISGQASTLPLWLYGFKMLAYRITINTAARRAKKIIAVSNSTREDIIDNLLVNKSRVEVVYEGADDFKAETSEKIQHKNYFLFVGNVYPHKNADKLIEAFEIFSKDNENKLVFVGKDDFFYKRLRKKTKSLEKSGKLFFEFNVSDQRLAALYKNSIALIRPSLMEGFSLPPLEALMSKTLALVSDIPVHREILKDSAIYFNPNDTKDIISKMIFVRSLDEKERIKLISKGQEITSKFSWEESARKTLKIYESSLSL